MAVIGVDKGHCLKGSYDYGAMGIRNETDCTREIGNKVIQYLEHLGHTVVDCTVDYANSIDESLNRRITNANAQYLDLLVDIHMNCVDNPSANGALCFIHSRGGNSEKYANQIQNEIVKLGYKNRGVQVAIEYLKHNLAMLKYTNAPAVLIECAFISNYEDMNLYDADKLARAIVKGITGEDVDKDKKYYIVTNYLPKTYSDYDGIDVLPILNKYFNGIRTYVKKNNNGIWLETQYISKDLATKIHDMLSVDGLQYSIMEE